MNESISSTKCETPDQQEQDLQEEEFREGGYGWVCVVCVAFINAHTWGINAAYGVFLSYYLSSEHFPGTTALQYAFVGGLSIGGALLIAPLGTYISQRVSNRLVLNIGTVVETVSLITTSLCKNTWQLFLSQGVAFGFGMGLCFVASVGIPSHWFKKRRSLANGIASGGSGVGGLIYSLATRAMIQHLSLEWAARILGILCFVVNVVCSNLLRIPPQSPPAPNSSSAKKNSLWKIDYILLVAWAFLSGLGYVVLLFSLPSYAVAIGLTQQQGSIAGALLSLGQAFGRPGVGLLSDKLGRFEVSIVASFLTGLLTLVLWIFAHSAGLLYFFAVFVGLFCGTFLAAVAPLSAEVVGLQNLGNALGITFLILSAPMAVGEAIALELRDSVTDSKPYLRVQIFTGFIYIGSAVLLTILQIRVKRKNSAPSTAAKVLESREKS